MSEPKLIEHHEYNNELLKYSDLKYKYVLMRDLEGSGEDYIWLLTETKEDAIKRLKVETNAYDYDKDEDAMENYNFYVCEIIRKEMPKCSRGRININIYCPPIENLKSENVRGL